MLKLLGKRLRQAWPKVRILFRGDSGFCRWRLLRWCENHGVQYVVRLAKNARMLKLAGSLRTQAQSDFASQQVKQRQFGEVEYGAESWDRKRRVLVKAAHTAQGVIRVL